MKYFVEQYRDIRKPVTTALWSPEPQPISKLKTSLKATNDSLVLQTVAVFKITPKPGVIIARHDKEVGATIFEQGK